ncbi:hypothetical protein ABEY82_24990 [Priestia megaterium]|jgi:hypothetical protein
MNVKGTPKRIKWIGYGIIIFFVILILTMTIGGIYQLKQKAAASMLKRLLFYLPTFVTIASPFFPTRTVAKRASLSTLLPVPSGIK